MRNVSEPHRDWILTLFPALSWGWLYSPSGFQPHWSLRTFSCIIPCVSVCECVFLQAEKQVHLTNCSNVMTLTREPAALALTGSRQMKKVTDRSLWRLRIFLSLREEKRSRIHCFPFYLIKSNLCCVFFLTIDIVTKQFYGNLGWESWWVSQRKKNIPWDAIRNKPKKEADSNKEPSLLWAAILNMNVQKHNRTLQ